MSAIGNIFWSIFDRQQGTRTHEEALAENRAEAKENLRNAGRAFASPFTTIRDAYRAEPKQERGGFRKLGLGLATAFAFVPLAARGLISGAFWGLMALKNGVIDGAAHGVATMFDGGGGGSTQPANDGGLGKPSQSKPPKPAPAPQPAPAKKPAPRVNVPPRTPPAPQPTPNGPPAGRKIRMKFSVEKAN